MDSRNIRTRHKRYAMYILFVPKTLFPESANVSMFLVYLINNQMFWFKVTKEIFIKFINHAVITRQIFTAKFEIAYSKYIFKLAVPSFTEFKTGWNTSPLSSLVYQLNSSCFGVYFEYSSMSTRSNTIQSYVSSINHS